MVCVDGLGRGTGLLRPKVYVRWVYVYVLYHTVRLHFLRCPCRLGQIDFFGDLELWCAIPKCTCGSFVYSVKGSGAVVGQVVLHVRRACPLGHAPHGHLHAPRYKGQEHALLALSASDSCK